MAGWHSCSGGLSPIIAPVPGISSAARGVADGYTRSSEMYNGAPTWHGVSNGCVAYMCSGSWAGRWIFETSEAEYLANRAECKGFMLLNPSTPLYTGGWRIYTGTSDVDPSATSKWVDATPSISCGLNCPTLFASHCSSTIVELDGQRDIRPHIQIECAFRHVHAQRMGASTFRHTHTYMHESMWYRPI